MRTIYNHSICFIIPYFGKLPSTFPAWLSSAAYNSTIDFMFFTDNPKPDKCPVNVIWNCMSWNELIDLINNVIGFSVKIQSPYKLCDLKPAYGDIFYQWIENYDFWGWCDIDLVFGNIRTFAKNEDLETYEKFGDLGHCVLMKNTVINRYMYREKCCGEDLYRTVFTVKSNMSFDEGNGNYGFPTICYEHGLKVKRWESYCDIKPHEFVFNFSWGGGKTFCSIYSF